MKKVGVVEIYDVGKIDIIDDAANVLSRMVNYPNLTFG